MRKLCGKVEHPDGDYVLYADHARIVAEKDAEIQRLREALEGRRTNSGYDAALNPYQQKE